MSTKEERLEQPAITYNRVVLVGTYVFGPLPLRQARSTHHPRTAVLFGLQMERPYPSFVVLEAKGKTAEKVAQIKRGSLVLVEGYLHMTDEIIQQRDNEWRLTVRIEQVQSLPGRRGRGPAKATRDRSAKPETTDIQ